MGQVPDEQLFQLADSILAAARLISASKEHAAIYRSAGATAESWTPLESAVLCFIDRHPGTSAGAAAEATQVIASNFSRALRGLERKGFVRREADPHDARRVHLYPTDRAGESLGRLQNLWAGTLAGIFDDPGEVEAFNSALRRIETVLTERGRPERS